MKWKITVTGSCSFAIVAIAVVYLIHRIGAGPVAAFGTVMSFIAAAVASVAAITYVAETARLVQANTDMARETSEMVRGQNRVADLMLADLRFRVAPSLKFINKGGPIHEQNCSVANIGKGAAMNVTAELVFSDSIRRERVFMPQMIESGEEISFRVCARAGEPAFTVTFSCTDLIGFSDYSFVWSAGTLVGFDQKERQAGSPSA